MKQTVEEAAREYSNDCRNRQRHCEPYCIVDRNMTEKQKQQYLTAQQAREIATTPYREVFTKIKMAAESGKCSLTIGFCTDVSELVEILKSVGYSVTLTTSYRDSVMKIHRIYSIQW